MHLCGEDSLVITVKASTKIKSLRGWSKRIEQSVIITAQINELENS